MARTTATNRTDSTARVADGYRLNRQEHSPSASFNGSSTGITLGFKANSTGFTIAAWIKVRRFTAGDRIFDQQDSGPSKGFAVLMPVTASDRSLYFSVFGDSSEEANIKIALNIWEWTHIAISFEPNSAKFYKNGVLAGTDTSVSLGDSVTNLVIGKNASSAANYFNGLMKDFVVYDRVLSLAEVENVRDGIVSQTNLKCHLPLSSDLADISVNGNDGTATVVFTYTNDSPFNDTVGLNMYAPLKSSLLLERGVGYPTWSRATKAWGFNELGYLEELPSGCAVFGGARLVQNLAPKSETFTTGWSLGRAAMPVDGKLLDSVDAGTHRMYFTAAIPGPGAYMAWFEVKAAEWSKCAVGVHANTESGGARVLFDLSTGAGEFHAGLIDGSFTSTLLADGWVKVIVRGNLTSTSIGVFLYTANDSGVTNYTGDGTKGILVRKAMVCDVTNYDASYVPEYVSVGVVASPFFGAGIDGAKYFETDWQGAPIAAANLLGFRREVTATNNLRFSRNLYGSTYAELGSSSTPKVWEPSTTGSSLVTNGTFDTDLTGWTNNGTSSASVVAGKLRIDATGGNGGRYQDLTLTVGKTYYITADATLISGSGTMVLTIYGSAALSGEVKTTWLYSSGSYGTIFKATATTQRLYLSAISALVVDFDNVVVKECTCVPDRTATGLDGIANTATTLTATAADAIILQPITLASAARCASAYVKRRTGTGTISFTQDGTNWTDITAQINSSTWSRVQITSTLANPSTGFKISTSGDAIDVDVVQNEAGAVATSLILTTTAAVTRNAESLTYQTASNIDFSIGTLYGEIQTQTGTSTRQIVSIGTSYSGIVNNAVSSWRAYDGTTIVTKNGLSDIRSALRKRAISWGGAGLTSTGDGLVPAVGVFSGTFAAGATMAIGSNANGYIRNVAIYNYQMTDAELQALTT